MKLFKITQNKKNKTKTNTNESLPYQIWIAQELIKPENSKYDNHDINLVIEWLQNTSFLKIPQNYNLEEAYIKATEWARKKEEMELISQYENNDPIYSFNDGWKIVKLSPSDVTIETELLERTMPYELSDYVKNKTFFAFSLRNPENYPKATIVMSPWIRDEHTMNVHRIIGREDEINPNYRDQPLAEYQAKIKEWFSKLKQYGYVLNSEGTFEDTIGGSVEITDLHDTDYYDEYGLPMKISGIGGDINEYFRNINEAEQQGWSGSYFYQRVSNKIIDSLIEYAKDHKELALMESAVTKYEEDASERFMEYEDQIEFTNPYPNEDDFMVYPEQIKGQKEFGGEEFKGEPIFDKEGYQKSLEAHDKEKEEYEKLYEPYQFGQYVYENVQKAIEQSKKEDIELTKKREKLPSLAKNMKTVIYKISENKNVPNSDILSAYVESLKSHTKDNLSINKELKKLIDNLPSPRKIKQDYSKKECEILYETLGHIWKKLTGQNIIEETKIEKAPESLMGNYWMFKNGILLHGTNSYDIIKRNSQLICTLLDIGGMTLQSYLHSNPNKLIQFILKNGGVRLFINKNKKFYCQMSQDTYKKWAGKKIRKYDFNDKVVKVIDFKADYKGWKSGVAIICL